MKRQQVIAIGLDSAEPTLLEEYMSAGHLPALSALKQRGASLSIEDFDLFSAETPWTTFATGCSPTQLGYWTPLQYDPQSYSTRTRAAYEYDKAPPFFALGEDYRVAVFDLPQVRIVPDVNGLQVTAWGAHSPQSASESSPPALFDELVSQFGKHPTLHTDYAECLRVDQVERLRQMMPVGIERRAKICEHLLKQEDWDLFITAFGEPHAAGHNMWQVSRPEHPLYAYLAPQVEGDPMLDIYKSIDSAIARIVEAANDDAHIVVFSVHGMGSNTMDLESILMLPELMYRYSFPGERMLGCGRSGKVGEVGSAVDEPVIDCIRDHWGWEVWATQEDSSSLRRQLRMKLPWGAFKRLQPLLGSQKHAISNPFDGKFTVPWQPAQWFSPLWPQMKAFALPSFSEGYIRVNLKGRDPHGIVEPQDYEATLDEITQLLEDLVDARSGVKMVRKIWRTKKNAADSDPNLPEPDLVVGWQEQEATDTVDSPQLGRIGPVPHVRSGSHRPTGFATIAGPGISPGTVLEQAHALDLAPTLLQLLGAPIPSRMQGSPIQLFERKAGAVA